MKPQAGQRITAPFLSTRAEVKTLEQRLGYCLLEVVLDDGHQSYRSLNLSEEQLAQVELVDRPAMALGDGIAAEVFFEAQRGREQAAHFREGAPKPVSAVTTWDGLLSSLCSVGEIQ